MLPITNQLKEHLSFHEDSDSIIDLADFKEMSLRDAVLNKKNLIEPHYHLNCVSLIYLISGALDLTLINPQTKKKDVISLTKGEMKTIPQGWWHYKEATKNKTQIITIFNTNKVQTLYGSDLMSVIPPEIIEKVFGVDSKSLQENKSPDSGDESLLDGQLKDIAEEFKLTSRLLPYEENIELERAMESEAIAPHVPEVNYVTPIYYYPYYCYRCGQVRYFSYN